MPKWKRAEDIQSRRRRPPKLQRNSEAECRRGIQIEGSMFARPSILVST